MKKEIVKMYFEKSDRHPALSWGQVVAVDSEGAEYVIAGSYCGGVPESHWAPLINPPGL